MYTWTWQETAEFFNETIQEDITIQTADEEIQAWVKELAENMVYVEDGEEFNQLALEHLATQHRNNLVEEAIWDAEGDWEELTEAAINQGAPAEVVAEITEKIKVEVETRFAARRIS